MNKGQTSRQSGFTVIELIVVALVFALAALLVFLQVNKLNVASRDSQRKTAVNAMYYALEEVYYKEHKSYPVTLVPETLPSVDPDLFTDPDGFTLGKEILSKEELQKLIDKGDASPSVEKRLSAINAGKSPNYHYSGSNCDTDGNCKSFTLRADLQSEAEYVKKSRQHQ